MKDFVKCVLGISGPKQRRVKAGKREKKSVKSGKRDKKRVYHPHTAAESKKGPQRHCSHRSHNIFSTGKSSPNPDAEDGVDADV